MPRSTPAPASWTRQNSSILACPFALNSPVFRAKHRGLIGRFFNPIDPFPPEGAGRASRGLNGVRMASSEHSAVEPSLAYDRSTTDPARDVHFLPQCCVSAWPATRTRAVSPGRVLSVDLVPSESATSRDKMHSRGLVRRRTGIDMGSFVSLALARDDRGADLTYARAA